MTDTKKKVASKGYSITKLDEFQGSKSSPLHILLDSDAIISIQDFDVEDKLLKELKDLEVTFCYIFPISIELMKTNSSTERLERMAFLENHNLIDIWGQKEHNKIKPVLNSIQKWMFNNNIFTPSPVDYYIAAYSAIFHSLILTANIQDFPAPLFTKKSHIVLNSAKSVKTLSLLEINNNELNKYNV